MTRVAKKNKIKTILRRHFMFFIYEKYVKYDKRVVRCDSVPFGKIHLKNRHFSFRQ